MVVWFLGQDMLDIGRAAGEVALLAEWVVRG